VKPKARVLALDLGKKRIGIAISDGLGLMAHGLETLERTRIRDDLDRLAALGMLTCGSGKKLDSFVPIRIRGRAASDAILRDRVDRF